MFVIEKEGFEQKDALFPQSQTFRAALKENKQHTFPESKLKHRAENGHFSFILYSNDILKKLKPGANRGCML